jgi:hypothetical protein
MHLFVAVKVNDCCSQINFRLEQVETFMIQYFVCVDFQRVQAEVIQHYFCPLLYFLYRTTISDVCFLKVKRIHEKNNVEISISMLINNDS